MRGTTSFSTKHNEVIWASSVRAGFLLWACDKPKSSPIHKKGMKWGRYVEVTREMEVHNTTPRTPATRLLHSWSFYLSFLEKEYIRHIFIKCSCWQIQNNSIQEKEKDYTPPPFSISLIHHHKICFALSATGFLSMRRNLECLERLAKWPSEVSENFTSVI